MKPGREILTVQPDDEHTRAGYFPGWLIEADDEVGCPMAKGR